MSTTTTTPPTATATALTWRGTIGGKEYGLAKDVSLVVVRVLDCNGSGSTEGVVAGVDWVTQNHSGPSVANMSLGGGADETLDGGENTISGTSMATPHVTGAAAL